MSSANASIARIVHVLVDELGAATVAVIAGITNTSTLEKWSRGEAAPTDAAEQRLRATFRVHQILRLRLDAGATRAWFFGANHNLADEMPLTVLAKHPQDWSRVVSAAGETVSL